MTFATMGAFPGIVIGATAAITARDGLSVRRNVRGRL
jgi:hypothetical protein